MGTNEHTPGAQAPGGLSPNWQAGFDAYGLPAPGAHVSGGGWLHPDTRKWLDAHARADWHEGQGHVAHVMAAVLSGLSAHLDVAPPGASMPAPSTMPGEMRLLLSMGGELYTLEIQAMGPRAPCIPVLEPEARGDEVFPLFPFPKSTRDYYDGVNHEPVSAQQEPPQEPVPAQQYSRKDDWIFRIVMGLAAIGAGTVMRLALSALGGLF